MGLTRPRPAARNLSAPRDLEAKLAELAEHLAADLASEDLRGRTLTLKLKCSNFEVGVQARLLPQEWGAGTHHDS